MTPSPYNLAQESSGFISFFYGAEQPAVQSPLAYSLNGIGDDWFEVMLEYSIDNVNSQDPRDMLHSLTFDFSFKDVQSAPEPSTLLTMLIGLMGLLVRRSQVA